MNFNICSACSSYITYLLPIQLGPRFYLFCLWGSSKFYTLKSKIQTFVQCALLLSFIVHLKKDNNQSTTGRALVLHVADLVSIPHIPFCLPSSARSEP